MSLAKLGLKCGIEIHQQLEGRKLFGPFPTIISKDNNFDFEIKRYIRASAGEGGKIDAAAAHEHERKRLFIYRGLDESAGLVEIDGMPPIPIDEKAMYASLQFAKMVGSDVAPVVQVMRKTVADGSNTTGFQRTALVARGGQIQTDEGEVRIANISIEEDSCRTLEEKPEYKIYHLDRLGIPLIEIGTEPDIKTPQQCQDAAKKIGMLLRSLPNVKRGLGTIRQDVNVSIRGGARIEIKGAQDLKMIPTLVELEAGRQCELLKIKEELRGVRLNEFTFDDVSTLLQDCESKRIKKVIEDGGVVLGMKLHGFGGVVGRELQPNYRLGTEFSGRAKVKAGVGGIFHSDELPAYGISEREVKLLRKKLKCGLSDAFILVVSSFDRARRALESVYERAQEVFEGIPQEVRKANQDGTSTYMRPMPGAARMYPETDVPLIFPDADVEIPELIEERIERFAKDFGLSSDLARFIAKSSKSSLFEELVGRYTKIKPAFIADVLTGMLVEIKRKYNIEPDLSDDQFRELFEYLNQDKIHKDIVLDVLIDMSKGEFDIGKYEGLSTEEIHAVIKEIVESNKGAPFGALMGKCMKALAGKASGQVISAELKKLLSEGHE